MLTASPDLLVWPLVTLLIMRALLRGEDRWWLLAGLVVGLSSYNKLLVVVLLISIGAGLLIAGPRRVLWSRPVLAGVAIALLVGAPNVIYQLANGLPQLDMGRALADDNAGDVRVQMWPFLLLLLGPPLVWIWVAGLRSLWRRPEWRPVRALAPAFGVLLVLVFVMGSQLYYPIGLLSVIFAAGCVPVCERRDPQAVRWRAGWVALNAVVAALIGLPIVPLHALKDTPIPAIDESVGDQVGWPAYVAQIGGVARAAGAQAIVTSNYGEAGAVDRFGRGLPAVYSAQNALYDRARPPAGARVVVFVGGELPYARTLFTGCAVRARLDNGVGVDNEEQDEPVAICRDPRGGWARVWPQLRHLD